MKAGPSGLSAKRKSTPDPTNIDLEISSRRKKSQVSYVENESFSEDETESENINTILKIKLPK